MRKITLSILFAISILFVKSQAVIEMHDTIINLPLISLPLTSCSCNSVSYSWKNVSGNPVTFALTNTQSTVISGFISGTSKISLTTVDNKGQTWSDILTLTFTNPNQPCDSAGIIAAYIKAHPCPITPCPPPRNAIGYSVNAQTGAITFTYDSGPLSIKKPEKK